jgi:hypothetical protein
MVLFEWSVAAHNKVNARIGKPVLTTEQAMAIWTQELPKSQFDIKIAIIVILAMLLLYMFSAR